MGQVFGPRACAGSRVVAPLSERVRAFRRFAALLATAALLSLPARAATPPPPGAGADAKPSPSGQVTAAGGLTLDGSPAVAGQTFFNGSVASAAERTRPTLALDNLARLELSGGTTLRLNFSAKMFGGSLEAGGMLVYAPRGVAASLTTADASVMSDPSSEATLFSVEVSEDGTTLTVQAGRVEMRAGGRSLAAEAGQSLRAAHGSAPAPTPPQGNNLSSKKKTGIFVGIAAALAAVIIVIAGRDDDEIPPPEIPCPVPSISPVFPLPPGC